MCSFPKTPLITACMTDTTNRSTRMAFVRAHRLAVSTTAGGAFNVTALLMLASLAAVGEKRHELLGGRQRSVVAVQAGLRRVDVPFHGSNRAIRRCHDIAHPFASAVADPRPEDAGRERFLFRPDPHPVPQFRAPG